MSEGAAAEYESDQFDDEDEEQVVIESDVKVVGAELDVEGEELEVSGANEAVVGEKEGIGGEYVEDGEEIGENVGEGSGEKKENEPFAVPTAGAFYMHDDRFRESGGAGGAGGGRHR